MAGCDVIAALSVGPLVVALLMLVVAGFRLRALRPTWIQWVVLITALLASAVVMPLSRQLWEGHEAEYLDIALTGRAPATGNAASMPAMQGLMQGLGSVWPSAAWVRTWALGAGALGCAAWSAAVTRWASPKVGLVAGLILAVWGNLAAWSSSAYNVVFPFACVSGALWALSLLLDGEDPLGAGLLAGALGGLAVALRLDLVVIAPLGGVLLLLHRPVGLSRWGPGLVLGALVCGVSLAGMAGGELPGQGELLASFQMNRLLLVYFEPFQRLWVLPAVLTGSWLALRARARIYAPVLAMVIWVHLSMSCFNDYGARHLLAAGLGVSAAMAWCVTQRWAWPALVAAGAGMLLSLWDTRTRFYAEEEQLAEAVDAQLPVWGLEDLGSCARITEDERVAMPGAQLSHFNLWDPAELASLQAQHGCVYWLMGVQDYRWSSLAVRDRALRIERMYEAEVVAVVKQPELGYLAVVFRIDHARRWPRATPVRTLP